ncbi:polysaccharide deacetylase [Amycolatopsis sulphurea]|uniref:Polysaccharide deacetylase n=1 Tax=Amycolatopsis sulphurea TaxID=76022 RepID=A0A2A9F9S1_9PSEU|nr:polysaccharide deacetylase family protein [Amycolatopsis sulphurea]PFG47185.1 polysaccharide deacetylase [Amycolatopsis sulphurea]
MDAISPARPLKVAVTVDDFVLWDGVPMPAGRNPVGITRSLAKTLAEHGLTGTYGFSHTYRLDREPHLMAAFEAWAEAGHHLGNHTHQHAPLRWMSGADFLADTEKAEKHIGHLVDAAPSRYFRYPMDMSSGSERKRGEVEESLRRNGYRTAPITTWFSDFAWIVPYYRAVRNEDAAAAARLRELYVSSAVDMLARHSATARALFGADMPYIWLIHGTTIAVDTLGDILDAFAARGVEFVSLDEAMKHPANYAMPPCTDTFSNHLQRFAVAAGRPAPELEMSVLGEVLMASPIEGMDTLQVYEDRMLRPLAARVGAEYDWQWA